MMSNSKMNASKSWTKEDFVMDKQLGHGRFATVYRALEKESGVLVALKVINKQFLLKHNFLHQIRREVEIQSKLEHPNIIRLYGYFQDKTSLYLVEEFAENGALFEYVHAKKRLDVAQVKRIAFQILAALHYLEQRKIMHRDIKLENILLDKNGEPKLADFGWAVHAITGKRKSFCGTVLYLPPELISKQEYDFKVDIWSLGILLFELATGKAPFAGEDNNSTLESIKSQDYTDQGICSLVEDTALNSLLTNVRL
jgi:serine/threonine protein kinase